MINERILPLYPCSESYLTRSVGCYLYSEEGKQYLDFESGVWCCNLGHSNQEISNIIQTQIQKLVHQGYRFRNSESECLANILQEKMQLHGGQSVFLSSGSEAVELSITLAKHLTGKNRILKLTNSYLSAFGIGKASISNNEKLNLNMDDEVALSSLDFSDISAFVVETGGASIDMVQFPKKDFILKAIDLARSSGVLIIAEEVTTGLGRMGNWFDFQNYGYKPDIVVVGKALGNGYPISAVTVSSSVAKSFSQNVFRYAQSHQNDPLGCAIGFEVIRQMEEHQCVQKSKVMGSYFLKELKQLTLTYPDIFCDARGRGLMLALELNQSVNAESLNNYLFEEGFVIGFKQNTFRFLPPLVINQEQIDYLICTILYWCQKNNLY